MAHHHARQLVKACWRAKNRGISLGPHWNDLVRDGAGNISFADLRVVDIQQDYAATILGNSRYICMVQSLNI